MFKDCHPAVNLIFFFFALVMAMFSNDPFFTALALIFSWSYTVVLNGKSTMKSNLQLALPILIIMALVNTLFTHNGATVMFYINDARITLEALLFGINASLVLTSVILWFIAFSEIMTSDKLIYIFGKARPVMGLTMSMIFRFIPLLKQRFREIQMGQRCMGRTEETKLIGKVRQFAKEVSILVSWSLESAIETSDSMEARGYGLPGRTSFHLFKITPKDKRMMAIIIVLAVLPVTALILGKTDIYYYPRVVMADWDLLRILAIISYAALMAVPIANDIKGNRRWQLSGQNS